MGILKKLLDSEYKELKRFDKLADEIISLEDSMANLKDEDFKNKVNYIFASDTKITLALKKRLRK